MRSVLFAPGNQPTILSKLPRSGPDSVVLDLEDAVPDDQKLVARQHTARVGAELVELAGGPHVFVRVNAVPSRHFGDDFEGVPTSATGVAVPKLESAEQVAQVIEQLDRCGLDELVIIAGLETAIGVFRAAEILDNPRVCAGYFGAEDFIADMGGVRTASNAEVSFARAAVALAARVRGVAAIDQIVSDLSDGERFRAEAHQAKAMGYAGKLCIHPAQVELANLSFTATSAEIEHAHRLVAAYDAALADGRASIAFEGQMIDEALVRRARMIVSGQQSSDASAENKPEDNDEGEGSQD